MPKILPFRLELDKSTGRLVQVADAEVERALEAAYHLGSMIAGRLDGSGIGKTYADDFLEYVDRSVGSVSGLRILEIGSGTGYLLSRLARKGALTVGVEPGDHSQDRFVGPNVQLVRDFFPSNHVDGTFDIVIMYNVLEHVDGLDGWFGAIAERLAPGGHLLISVPSCDEFITSGDPSILVHEHFSYFTSDSLSFTLSNGGFGSHRLEPSGVGRSWYAMAEKADQSSQPDLEALSQHAESFRRYSLLTVDRFAEFLSTTRNASESVAIYVPLRAINAIVMSGAPIEHCRFFDDDSNLQGHYLPGSNIVIEAQEALVEDPTDHVAIMSESFGHQIRERLVPKLPAGTRIRSLSELTS